MFAAAFLLATAAPPPTTDPTFPLVRLEDAHWFGVSREQSRLFWNIATRHKEQMRPVIAGGWNNNPDVVAAWEADCDWRSRVYFYLDDVLFCEHLGLRARLRSLDMVRQLIGDEAYYTGRLPAPTPAYKIPER